MTHYLDTVTFIPKGPRKPARWRLRIMIGGVRHVQTFGSKLEAERSRNQLRARKAATALGLPDPVIPHAELTLEKAFDDRIDGLKKRRRAELTILQMEQHKTLWVAWGGAGHTAALTTRDLEDFSRWFSLRSPDSKGGMIAKSVMIVRGVVKRAGLPVPPDIHIDVPRRAPRTVGKPALLKFLAAMPLGTVERTFAELVLRTNGRESELRRLTVGDVDLKGRRLLLSRRKGGTHEKWVPLSAALAGALRPYSATVANLQPEAPFLALGGEGEPRRALDRLSLRKRLWRACDAAGLPRRGGLGWLRHEAATLLRERGESLRRVGQGMGHTSSRVVEAHYDESARRAAEEWRTRRELGARLDRIVPIANRGQSVAKPNRSRAEAHVVPQRKR